jgi:Serine dehydrogenase proteinase
MTPATLPVIRALVEALEAIRGRRAIFYHSAVCADSIPVMYECLRRGGRSDGLDLVLSTGGGAIASSRQLAMLLREFTGHLSILVPYRARSAGTLVCLSANELVLGPLAELGPVDSTMDSEGVPAPDAPGTISAQDILAFRSMAQDWFGVDRPQDRLQVLGLLATRIFPTSLSSFYRFDKLVREVAAELLEWQLPGEQHAGQREMIVDRLVSGYHSHDVVLSRRDVRALGLRAADATPEEEGALWALSQAVQRPTDPAGPHPGREAAAVIAASDFGAAEIIRQGRIGQAGQEPDPEGSGAGRADAHWEIFDQLEEYG